MTSKEQAPKEPKELRGEEKPLVILVAAGANVLIAVAKFFGAAITGSSAMASEGVHSVIDTGNDLLILLGKKRARREADALHPMGYGRELYFWALIVAISIFGFGGGASIYEGIQHLRHPEPITRPTVNYVILGIALVAESLSFSVAYRKIRRDNPRTRTWEAIRRTHDPSTFTVLFEDAAAVLGILIAAAGIALGQLFQSPIPDGAASIAIGSVLVGVSYFIARETKGLLVGEAALPEFEQAIRGLLDRRADIARIERILALVIGPRQIAVIIDAHFDEALDAGGVAEATAGVKAAVKNSCPEATRIFVEAV